MNKKYFLIVIGLLNQALFAQNPAINTELPKIIKPSPTVSSLMKFEEIPVSKYTGVPDISIPLGEFPTHSKDLKVNIALKYHPASIAADEVAGYAGLGWNLIAGGTISRTVRGLPDDILIGGTKLGIYQDDYGAEPNNYYSVSKLSGGLIPKFEREGVNRFLYENQVSGTYDSEHDLYQYNFMGNTGRFIIVKNNGQYEVQKLDNNNAIVIQYNHQEKVFMLYDEKGIRYLFDVKEITAEGSATYNTYFDGNTSTDINGSINYISAFHLSSVYDQNNKKLLEILYNTAPLVEATIDNTDTHTEMSTDIRTISKNIFYWPDQVRKFGPADQSIAATRSIQTKKIKQLLISDFAKIDFLNEAVREDDNLNSDAPRLQKIIIRDWLGNTIKFFDFLHTYSTVIKKRMILKKIIENDGTSGSYTFTYLKNYNQIAADMGKDYWGYFNQRPSNYPATVYKETDIINCKSDVLESISYPTKGMITFDYEANQYSAEGDQLITNFDENPANWSADFNTLNFTSTGGASPAENLNFSRFLDQRVSFKTTTNVVDGQGGVFSLYKLVNGASEYVMDIGSDTNDGTSSSMPGITLQAGIKYLVRFHWFNSSSQGLGSVSIVYKTKNPIQEKYLVGGGIRIKEINYLSNSIGIPKIIKQKKFIYNTFNDPTYSSGTLNFPKPIFKYNINKIVYYEEKDIHGLISFQTIVDLNQTKYTTFNNLLATKTQGVDVGYRNVTECEVGNGKTEYTYTSALEYPEGNVSLGFPFLPVQNFDYKRGLLLKEVVKNNYDKPVA